MKRKTYKDFSVEASFVSNVHDGVAWVHHIKLFRDERDGGGIQLAEVNAFLSQEQATENVFRVDIAIEVIICKNAWTSMPVHNLKKIRDRKNI